MKKIILRQDYNGLYYMFVDGKKKPTEFVDTADAREFLGTCQEHGLYQDCRLFVELPSCKLNEVQPTYKHPISETSKVAYM